MNTKIYIAAGIVLALAASCAKNSNPEVVGSSDRVQFDAVIDNGAVKTKFINPGALSGLAFSAGDKFYIGIENNVGGPANFSESACFRTITVGSGPVFIPNTPVYWDDLGGRETNSYIWGVYTHGAATPVIDKTGEFNWTVVSDQTTITDFQKLDLLYSNNKTSLVYTPDPNFPNKRDVADLTFKHAMTRVIINVKAGDGFTDTDFAAATATLDTMFTSVDVKMLNRTAPFSVKTDSAADIKMCKKATATSGYAATFDAIMVPGKKYTTNNRIAVLKVKGNTYNLRADQSFITALGDSTALVEGKYYTFNVTLGKSAITFNASITDWEDGYTTAAGSYENAVIDISADNKGADLTGDGKSTYTNAFDLYKSTDGINYDADADTDGVQRATGCTYDETTGTWSYDPAIYWQSANDEEYFRGFYPEGGAFASTDDGTSAQLSAGDTDYQWGTSGDEAVSPTTGKVGMLFNHVTAAIIVNLKTVTGSAAVTLDSAKVEIVHTIKDGSIDLHSGAITLSDEREDCLMTFKENKAGVYTHTTYALPQVLNGANDTVDAGKTPDDSDDAFLKITVNPNDPASINVYYFKLNTAKDGDAYITEWESNKTYTYNITIKKTAIEFDAAITDWVQGYNSSDIEIHL